MHFRDRWRGHKPEPARDKDGNVIERREPTLMGTWNRARGRAKLGKHSHAKHRQPGVVHKGRITVRESDND